MLRKIRHHLWLIGYHSATRHRTRWSRWIERTLFAAVFLAVPATLVMESLVTRSATTEQVSGRLAETEDEVLFAAVEEAAKNGGFREAILVGDWTLEATSTERGWPFPTLRAHDPPRLDLNRYERPGVESDARLNADDPIRMAIQDALTHAGRSDLATDWQVGRSTESRRHWRGTVAGTLAWWVSLSVTGVVAVRLLALGSLLRRARRAEASTVRASAGRCSGCNYDLRGLEFSARCPECGKLI